MRQLLNFSGFPFQHYCASKIAQLVGFEVATEFPYTYPPTNAAFMGTHGAIDVLAVCPTPKKDQLMCFVVECKKARKETKNWIFLQNEIQHPRWPTFVYTDTSESQLGDEGKLGVTRSLNFPSLGYQTGTDFDFCINGFEADVALKQTNSNQNEKIYNPLRQVVHGTRAFESHFPKIVESVNYFRHNDYGEQIYIPVVVTTANIFIADFPRHNVSQGEVLTGDLKLSEPKKWITYEFPLPDFLSYQLGRGKGATQVQKRTVFIVNDESMEEFFQKATITEGLTSVPVR